MESHVALELHDACVTALRREGEAVVLELFGTLHSSDGRPGVDVGRCWSASCRLCFERGEVLVGKPEAEEFDVYAGELWLGDRPSPNMLPLPLNWPGSGRLELSGVGGHLVVAGEGLRAELLGEPTDPSPWPP